MFGMPAAAIELGVVDHILPPERIADCCSTWPTAPGRLWRALMAFDASAFMDEFRAEAAERVRGLTRSFCALERDPSDPSPIREMFLAAHTIKGGAGMLGLLDVRELAHAMEDVLARLRDQHRPLDRDTADLLFSALDRLRDLSADAVPGPVTPDKDRASMVAALRERARALEPDSQEAASSPAPADDPLVAPAQPGPHPAYRGFDDGPDAGDDAAFRHRVRGRRPRRWRAGAGVSRRGQLRRDRRERRDT